MERKGLLENQISVCFLSMSVGDHGWSKKVGKEAGCLVALERLGPTQVECKSFGQMKVQTLGKKREISKGGGQLGLALDPGKGKDSFFFFLSTEDMVPESQTQSTSSYCHSATLGVNLAPVAKALQTNHHA